MNHLTRCIKTVLIQAEIVCLHSEEECLNNVTTVTFKKSRHTYTTSNNSPKHPP